MLHWTFFADSVDLDQTAQNVQSDLNLHHPLAEIIFYRNQIQKKNENTVKPPYFEYRSFETSGFFELLYILTPRELLNLFTYLRKI